MSDLTSQLSLIFTLALAVWIYEIELNKGSARFETAAAAIGILPLSDPPSLPLHRWQKTYPRHLYISFAARESDA